MREWYRIQLKAEDDSVADIQIVDFIGDWIDDYWGFGVTAKAFIEQLAALPESVKTLRVHVNSPGGDVMAALNIANALRDQRATKGRAVETIVDGLAASAATLILQAGDPIRIADNGIVMVHLPWSVALGNADEMRKAAEVLDTVRDTIVTTYQWHSPLTAKELGALMDAETWMDADEAIANGFATEKVEGLKAAAALDPRATAKFHVPERFQARVTALLRPEPSVEPAAAASDGPAGPIRVSLTATEIDALVPGRIEQVPPAVLASEVLQLCRGAGLDLDFAMALIEEGVPLTAEQVQSRITDEQGRRQAAASREEDIRALCTRFDQDDLAPGLVASGMTFEAVKDHLSKIVAKLDRVEIDGALKPDHGTKRGPAIDVVAVYAERNRPRLVQ